MATPERHAQHAESYRQQALTFLDEHPAISGRFMWGATIQAAQAASHRNGNDEHPITRRKTMETISNTPHRPETKTRMLRTAAQAAKILNQGFYRPELVNPETHRKIIAETAVLIDTLLQPPPPPGE